MASKEKGSTYSEKLNYLLGIERYSRNLDYEKIEGACRDILPKPLHECLYKDCYRSSSSGKFG